MKLNIEVEGTWLTPLRFSHSEKRKGHSKSVYWFKCRCGNKKQIRRQAVMAASKGKATGTKSCGCRLRSFPRPWLTEHQFKEGNKFRRKTSRPRNTGKPAWNTGRVKLKYPDGRVEWIKVSDEPLGPNHKWRNI